MFWFENWVSTMSPPSRSITWFVRTDMPIISAIWICFWTLITSSARAGRTNKSIIFMTSRRPLSRLIRTLKLWRLRATPKHAFRWLSGTRTSRTTRLSPSPVISSKKKKTSSTQTCGSAPARKMKHCRGRTASRSPRWSSSSFRATARGSKSPKRCARSSDKTSLGSSADRSGNVNFYVNQSCNETKSRDLRAIVVNTVEVLYTKFISLILFLK